MRVTLAVEMGCGKTADTSSNDDQIERLSGSANRPGCPGHSSVHRLPRTRVTAAQTGFGRRIVVCSKPEIVLRCAEQARPGRQQGCAQGDLRTVEKIPPGDSILHWFYEIGFTKPARAPVRRQTDTGADRWPNRLSNPRSADAAARPVPEPAADPARSADRHGSTSVWSKA